MDAYAIVRPEHLNHHGSLFGGQLLKWVDEFAWIAAAREYPGCRLVTRAMESIEFRTPVPSGAILRFDIRRRKQGTTSVSYAVAVYSDEPGGPYAAGAPREKLVFSTSVTFASVDDRGEKRVLP